MTTFRLSTEHASSYKERRLLRKTGRRWKWILRRSAFEPLVASVALVMVASGLHLMLNGSLEDSLRGAPLPQTPLLFPLFFAYCLLLLGLCGWIGISIRSTALLVVFSFGGLILRTWMAVLYFAASPTELSWVNFACGAIVLFWIFSRVVCDSVARQGGRSRFIRESLARR